eukprot:g24167.t1
MYFKSVLEAFLRENGKSIPLKFKWATDMEFVPYSEMMTYRCGVLVPNDLTMASFAEVQAYGSMFFGRPEFLERPEVTSVVRAHGATSSQVLLRWALQMGFQIIPKSVKKHRIEENLKVFDIELTQMEMDSLSSMKGKLDQYWQPLGAPVDVGDTSRGKTEL